MKFSAKNLFAMLISIIVVSLTISTVLFYFLYNKQSESCNYNFINENEDFDSEPLLLTPYIKRGDIRKGQRLSSIKNWNGIDSYSGFLTVNETYGSNLFFWFFPQSKDFYYSNGRRRTKPSENDTDKAVPLILYLQGGPGISSMFGLFLETGPFHIDGEFDFHLRNYSWTKTHSMLYIDSPVGTGFSFTRDIDGYAKEQKDVARDLFDALRQFFTLFPEFIHADFYIAGTSYAGKYIPTLAYKIHKENNNSPLVPINLKGIAIGSGYFDSILQDEFSEFYYNMGLLDRKQKLIYQTEEKRIKILVEKELYDQARYAIANLFQSTRQNFTGFNDFLLHNALEPHTPPELTSFETFLNKKCVRSALHVGIRTFSLISYDAYMNFLAKDFFCSTQMEMEALLNANYKVLCYSSALDTIIISTSVTKFLRNLEWSGGSTYRTIERKIWKVGTAIYGYFKQTGNFVHVLIRNSGHAACYEQPSWCLDMINRFTSGRSF